jgi:uncharacterized lipoprotein YmbA
MNHSLQVAITIAVCAAVSALEACSPLAPVPDRTEYYVLSSFGAPDTAQSLPRDSDLSIGMGPIMFPEYLKRPEVVTRTAANKLDVSEEKRWGEPLEQDFARVLSQDLGQTLGTPHMVRYPWYPATDIDYQVEVDVESFETSADGRSQLTAIWTIRNPKDGRSLSSGRSSLSSSVEQGDVGASAAMSDDVAGLSREIAVQIRSLASQQSKSSDRLRK